MKEKADRDRADRDSEADASNTYQAACAKHGRIELSNASLTWEAIAWTKDLRI